MKEQISLFDNIDENMIVDIIKKSLPDYLKESGNIYINPNSKTTPYSSIMFSPMQGTSCYRSKEIPDGLICRVKTNGKIKFVSFSDQFKKNLTDSHLNVSKIESEDFWRIELSDFYSFASSNSEAFSKLISDVIISLFAFDRFDCCGKFKECSDAKKCLHDDMLYSTACSYRKKLENGIVFYGKNRTNDPPKTDSENNDLWQPKATSLQISFSLRNGCTITVGSENDGSAHFKSDRSAKGKSLIDFPKNFTVIDIETTGLSAAYDEIIELAAIKVRDGKISDTFSTLVKPENEISGFITQLTGITNEMVQDSPHISEALPRFLGFVNDDVIVGHNVNFDINFIYDVCVDNNFSAFSNNFIDTLRLSRRLYPAMKHHRLTDMIERLKISTSVFHRALADCESTLKCFSAMMEDVINQYGSIENFQTELSKSKHYNYVDARTITTDKTDFDTLHPLYGKVCVFTGKLEKMKRQEAMQIVVDLGGECANNVTVNTNYLILGNNDYCATIKGGKSNKQKKAEEYKLKGLDIEIMPESVFYDMIL